MKILVIHASAGAGHTKAAEAVYDGLKEHTNHDVTFVDVLDYTNTLYKKLYRKTYTLLITKVPWLWGFFFWVTDIPWLLTCVQFLRRTFNRANAQAFSRFLVSQQFDYIISTHFFPNEVAGYLKRTGRINSRIVGIVTDYDAHSIWLAAGIEQYAVACDYTKEKLVSLGVAPEHIIVTGIPVNEKFIGKIDTYTLRVNLNLSPERLTVLVATGSFGIGPIQEIVEQLPDVQLVVVCGHNKRLFKKLSRIKKPNASIFGLVNNMHELMALSDVMITKPGGLSITEALVSGLPLIFFSAIPGQETNNVQVLARYGVGLKSKNVDEIATEIKRLARSSDYFALAKNKTHILAKPAAVRDIIALIQ